MNDKAKVASTAVATRQIVAAPFAVRVKLNDKKIAASLPAGDASIYTPTIKWPTLPARSSCVTPGIEKCAPLEVSV
jgi:hypothetical protein